MFTIFAPIYQNGHRAGELFMTYELEEIQKMADTGILEDSMEIYLMNLSGKTERARWICVVSGRDRVIGMQ